MIDPSISMNTIRARAFHHRQFKFFLETEYEDIIYHNSERWLSKVIKRVWALYVNEILLFLDTRKICHDFVMKIGYEE